jgi:hypothetical protein
MDEIYAEEIHLVRVTTDDRERQIWVAAASREDAIAFVLNAVPEGWSAALVDAKLKPSEPALLKMKRGDVRKLRG